ncbi:hypothetical protein RF11_15733 [Thelohanellus kitauei]|uniref:Secreted protein n=1 Tax=Thelohanellus kitauei TaxID=669202 RepID=A0A0C2JKL7_THEKT|nr:hypothetical protein RF11_15733 [Thelohanellus kitauei]
MSCLKRMHFRLFSLLSLVEAINSNESFIYVIKTESRRGNSSPFVKINPRFCCIIVYSQKWQHTYKKNTDDQTRRAGIFKGCTGPTGPTDIILFVDPFKELRNQFDLG